MSLNIKNDETCRRHGATNPRCNQWATVNPHLFACQR